MTYRATFASGRHLAAARTLAGLKQTELAQLAGLHVNSLKRLERMTEISRHSKFSLERLAEALAAKGIQAARLPFVHVRLAEHGPVMATTEIAAPEFAVACMKAPADHPAPAQSVPEGQLSEQYARPREV